MPNCDECKSKRSVEHVPYIVHEGDMARLERVIKRLWVLLIVTVVALIGSNVAWVVYESQFEDNVTEIVETTSEAGDAYGTIVSGSDSEVYYGTGSSYTD